MSEQPFGTESEPAGTSPGVPEQPDPTSAPAADSGAGESSAPADGSGAAPAAEPEQVPGVVTPPATDYERPGRAEVHALIPANHPQWFRDVIDTLLNIIENGPSGT